jgi:hypothetical protein
MDSERWEQVAALYHSACERAPAERYAFLIEACRGDEDLRREVESLLNQDASQDGVLERVVQDSLLRSIPRRPLPAAIGRYRILGLVGEGGMGAVYEAEQDNPRRTVALKVVKPGLAAPELLRRFEQESQALGRLQHPGIAQIYEAGAADAGSGPQPYFAMEFIRGLALLDYAKGQNLNTRQRLEIMAKVCDAVQHAHRRGIIHRDLKPGNILVDDAGQPKVLDFGVARITDTDVRTTRQTDLGELVGTLAYMSPEQVLADPLEVDTRSDVYALGVVLYELLAGRLPYEISGKVHRAVQTIREEDPAPLSAVSRAYRGDVETIVAKALEKDRAQRYSSAAELAADLRRYLADQPILARPPSARYQLRKFASRHKGLLAAAVAMSLVLIAGAFASGWEAIRANRAERSAIAAEHNAVKERDRALLAEHVATSERTQAQQDRNRAVAEKQRADTEASTAKAINDFLQNDLLAQASVRAQAGPNHKPDPDLKVRTALDRATARIGRKFESQPLVEASLRATMGSTYHDLGLYDEAERQLERSLQLRLRALGPQHPETLNTMDELGLVYFHAGKSAEAETMLAKVIEARRSIFGGGHPETLRAMSDLAMQASGGNYLRSEALLAQVLTVERRVLGSEHPETLGVMNNLATEYVNEGKYDRAERLYREVVDVKRRVLGEEHPSTLLSMNNLGVVYRNQGKYSQAEALLTDALAARRRIMGEQHNDTLASMNSLALVYQAQAKYTQAEPLLRQVLEVRRHLLGAEHPDTLRSMNSLAELNQRQGRLAEAEALFTPILEAHRRVLGPQHPNTIRVLASLGAVKLQQRGYSEAEALLRQALDAYRKSSADSWRRYHTESMLGASLAGLGKYAEAEPLLVSGYQGMLQRKSSIPFENRAELDEASSRIAQLHETGSEP